MEENFEPDDDPAGDDYLDTYSPTPEEIAAECRRIRESWDSDRLKSKRSDGALPPILGGDLRKGSGPHRRINE